jgi:hypothetical protein
VPRPGDPCFGTAPAGKQYPMIKKLPGLVWILFLVAMAERKLAPGTFSRLLGARPDAA